MPGPDVGELTAACRYAVAAGEDNARGCKCEGPDIGADRETEKLHMQRADSRQRIGEDKIKIWYLLTRVLHAVLTQAG